MGASSSGKLNSGVATDLELQPFTSLSASLDDLRFNASYAPRLSWGFPAQPGSAAGPEVFHSLSVGADWHLARLWNLGVHQGFSFGTRSFSLLAPNGADSLVLAPTRPPSEQSLKVQSLDDSFSLSGALDPRLRFSLSGSWLVSGGADATARASLPLTRVAGTGAALNYLQDTHDSYSISLQAGTLVGRGTGGNGTANASLGWLHVFDKVTRVGLGVGAGYSKSAATPLPGVAPAPPITRLTPSGSARFVTEFSRAHVGLSLVANLAPVLDNVTGAAYAQLQGTAAASWSGSSLFQAALSAGASQSLRAPTGQGVTVAQGDASITCNLVRSEFALQTGLRGGYVKEQIPSAAQGFQWLGYLSLRVAETGRF